MSQFRDSRGVIVDLVPDFMEEGINAITLISSVKGAVRGNHFHKKTHQWTYVVKGKTRSIHVINGKTYDTTWEPGNLIGHAPGVPHAFEAIEDTEWLVFTKGPRAGDDYESDTFRLEVPLI